MNRSATLVALVAPIVLLGGFLVWHFLFNKKKLKPRKTDVSVCMVTSSEEWEMFYPQLMDDIKVMKVVGFDTEWVCTDGHRNPVALVQIASHSGVCLLVRLCYMHHDIPNSFKTFLSDRSILKVGVGVLDDGKKLMKDYGLAVRGCVDLRSILIRVRGMFECSHYSLQGLCEGILGQSLDKQHDVRCGNWEAQTFSEKQLDYAASDAVVAVDIFVKLVMSKLAGRELRSAQHSVDQDRSGSVDETEFLQTATSLCQGLVDAACRVSQQNYATVTDAAKVPDKKHDKIDMLRAYSIRQRPLYDNCQLMAPDGQMLCTCNASKAHWYITKGLGDKVSDDPLVVKLKFEPSGRPESDRNYYLQDKQNVCVVCGATDSYIRKFVVPQEYRKYFPPSLKDHRSHDILLLCPPCHQQSSYHDGILRQQLAVECDAALDIGSTAKSCQDRGLQVVKSAAKALKLSSNKIPEQRKEELRKILLDYFGVDSITDDLLKTACNMDIRIFNENYISHGQKVVNKYKSEHGLVNLEKRWRQHFLNTMQPNYLPSMWSVDHEYSGMDKADEQFHKNKMESEHASTSSRT